MLFLYSKVNKKMMYFCTKLRRMKIIGKLLFYTSFLLLFTECKPEFNQNADYKDITVTYGLLNPKDSAHYIKVYKAFLTDGNAILAAGDLDNISYYDQIDVSVEEYINDSLIRTLPFPMTTAIPKDSGIFAYNPQVLYYSTATLNPDALYKLKIINRQSGKEITAETPIVGNFSITQPYSDIASFLTSNSATVKFRKANNAVAYDIYLKFYYLEVNKNTGDTITPNGVIQWKVTRVRSEQSYIEVQTALNQLYTVIASRLKTNENLIRYTNGVECVELEVWGAEENYMIYLDINEPSSSLVQDRVMYTNMKTADGSAYGIFSSRNIARKKFKLINSTNNAARDSLLYGSITGHLGFE